MPPKGRGRPRLRMTAEQKRAHIRGLNRVAAIRYRASLREDDDMANQMLNSEKDRLTQLTIELEFLQQQYNWLHHCLKNYINSFMQFKD